MKKRNIRMGIISLIAVVCLAAMPAGARVPDQGDYSNDTATITTLVEWDQHSWIGDEGDNNARTVRARSGALTIANYRHLYIGDAGGSNNTLDILEGGTVAVSGRLYIGGNNSQHGANATDNSLTVSGVGSSLSIGSFSLIGDYGSNNALKVTDGGEVTTSNNLHIGMHRGSENNVVTIENATLNVGGTYINVGVEGDNNTFAVKNSTVTMTKFVVGNKSDSNTMTVSNSTVQMNGDFSIVGNHGGNNSLTLSNGSAVTFNNPVDMDADLIIGLRNGQDNQTLTVTGEGTRVTVYGRVRVGANSSNNILRVESGGILNAASLGVNANASVQTGNVFDVSAAAVVVDGKADFSEGATYRLTLHDKADTPLTVGGPATLGTTGAGVVFDLSLASGFKPGVGDVFTVLDYGDGSLTGAFAGLADGDTVVNGETGAEFEIYYNYNSENRIALVTTIPGAVLARADPAPSGIGCSSPADE